MKIQFFLQSEKEHIVKLHNELRSKVANGKEDRGIDGPQPRATNMRELVWSNTLANIAQRYYKLFNLFKMIISRLKKMAVP